MAPHRDPARAIVTLGALVLAGCELPFVVRQYDARQSALVPAPRGPHATGPMVPARRVALEASVAGTTVLRSGQSRSSGIDGHVIPLGTANARLAYGLSDRVELGLDAELASSLASVSVPSDGPDDWYGVATYFSTGLQVRAIVVGSERLGLGINGEASIATVPYYQSLALVSSREFDTRTGHETQTEYSYDWGTHVAVVPTGRVGLFGCGRPARRLVLMGGALLQTQPTFFGERVGANDPRGWQSGTVDPFTLGAVLTPCLSAGWTVGRVQLYAEVHVNALATDMQWVASAPLGAGLGARALLP